MASFTTTRPADGTASSFQRKRVHGPGQGNPADEQREEHQQEESDPFHAAVLPQQGEKDAGGDRVKKHQGDVVPQQAHSFLPSAMSNVSSTNNRFIRPAVMVNAVPCS